MNEVEFVEGCDGGVDRIIEIVRAVECDKIFVITDSNVNRLIENPNSVLAPFLQYFKPEVLIFSAGEEHKDIETVCNLWHGLSVSGASRNSLVVNIGGGVTTDLGGFVASTFKRGLRYINIPTSLLAMVDASVGGKTGFDYNGLKNEIGSFSKPLSSIIVPSVLGTLPIREILSGMAEVVKTAMISNREAYIELLRDFKPSPELIRMAVEEKKSITDSDPKEEGLRKILNFGHTAGHAFESLLLSRNISGVTHGLCVAHGILVSLILSHFKLGLPSERIHNYRQQILAEYPPLPITCRDIDCLIDLMRHDKKNQSGEIRFVLLKDIAMPVFDQIVSVIELRQALELKCDM